MSQTNVIPVTKKPFTFKEVERLKKILNAPEEERLKMKQTFRRVNNRQMKDINNWLHRNDPSKAQYVKLRGNRQTREVATKSARKASNGVARVTNLPTAKKSTPPKGTSVLKFNVYSVKIVNNVLFVEIEN
jgi:hypothetical protein